ncbi:MAG: hypothetical protein GY930_12950 [bacterium]|nr:hypothetical protein [bacterium]
MDSLALLCTLHADGPATLRRLRKAGCQSLVDLDRVGADSIATTLEIPPAMARRLVREARMLHQRVGGDTLDMEEAPEGMAVALLGNPQAPLTESSDLDDRDRGLIRTVLGDAQPVSGFSTEPAVEQPVEAVVELEPMGGAFVAQPTPQPDDIVELDQPEPLATEYRLVDRVDGLDNDVAATLSKLGIETLTALVEADASWLARHTGLSFGPLRRLQFLARKSLQVGGEVSLPVVEEASQVPPKVPAVETTFASFEVPASSPPANMPVGEEALEVQGAPEQEVAKAVSPMAPSPEAQDPFAREVWPEAKMPVVKELEPEASGPMAVPEAAESDCEPEVTELESTEPVPEPVQPLGRWIPREMRKAMKQPEQCKEPEQVLVPPPPPRRFWEPKRFWETRKNRLQAAAEAKAAQETENLQGGNLPPAHEIQPNPDQTSTPTRVEMPSCEGLGDLRWDFSEPRFKPDSGGRGGFQFEEPEIKEPQSDASGPFA